MTKVRRWRETIEAFRGSDPSVTADDDLRRLLDRLEKSREAAEAFDQLGILTAGDREAIVVTCIDTHVLARDFHTVIAEEKHFLKVLDDLEKAVDNLRSFVQAEVVDKPVELSALFRTGLQVRTEFSFEDILAMRRGLGAVGIAISYRRRTAHETLLRWGTTRKTGGKAKITAAVGYFGDSVRRICERPHEAAAAELVSAVLERQIFVDQLHAAEATRLRSWREE